MSAKIGLNLERALKSWPDLKPPQQTSFSFVHEYNHVICSSQHMYEAMVLWLEYENIMGEKLTSPIIRILKNTH